MADGSKCPVAGGQSRHTVASAKSNRDWWPNQLNLNVLQDRKSVV